MTYSLIAHTFSPGASSGSTTPAINTTGADLIVVGVVQTGSNTGVLSDSKSNTWTAIGTLQDSGQEAVRLFYCQAPTVGSGHTFTTTGASSFSSAFVQAFSGSVASPLDQQTGNASGTASFSIATGSITPTQNNELICVMYGNEGTAASQAMNSGMTLTDTQDVSGPAWGSSMGYKIQTTAAAINVTGSTGTNAKNAIAIASFKSPSTSTNVNLTAVAATAGFGNFAGNAPSLVAASATGGVAAIVQNVQPRLNGVAATAAAMSITNLQFTLVAASAAGAAAAFGAPSPSIALTAVLATGGVAPFPGSQTILLGASSTAAASGFSVPNLQPAFGSISATGAAASFTITGVNFVLNAATGYYALNGVAAGLTLKPATPPSFDFDVSYTWPMPPASGLWFISYNPFVTQLFVQYLAGNATLYNNITQQAAAMIAENVIGGISPAQALSGYPPG